MRAGTTEELENQQIATENSSRTRWGFGRVLKGLLLLDAAFVLYLTAGFILPDKPVRDTQTGGLPEQEYDYSAKISPLTPPASEPRERAVEVFKITARGPNPTFVAPVEATYGDNWNANIESTDSPASYNHEAVVIPASQTGRVDEAQPATNRTERVQAPAGMSLVMHQTAFDSGNTHRMD